MEVSEGARQSSSTDTALMPLFPKANATTTPYGKMRSIEAARALAAILVVLMHCGNLMRVDHFSGHIGLGGLFAFGYVGVDFFFVLSGFIIAYVHYQDIGRPRSLWRYLWRRLTRIYPIFWISLLLAILVIEGGRFIIGKPAGLEIELTDILGTIFLLPASEPKYVGVAWSLQYEIIFYLAFCVLILNRLFGVILFFSWSIYVITVMLDVLPLPNVKQLASPHCLQFSMGLIVGIVAREGYFKGLEMPRLWVPGGFFALAIVFELVLSNSEHGADGRIFLGLASSFVLWVLVELEKRNAINTPLWLASLGSVSYSIYLTHIIFINTIFFLLARFGIYHSLPEAFVFLFGFGGALLCASILGFAIELPLVAQLKRLVTK